MASRKLAVILKLKDEISKPLRNISSETKKVQNQVKIADARIKRFATSMDKKLTKAAKRAAVGLGLLGAAAVKTGFSEAFDMEGYRAQLETATKDTKKAAKIMTYAMNYANKTPFEGNEVVEGAAKFESMGMSAKKWLTYTGDMAGATNKSFDQAVEALIDAQTGELERLKEFGITKRQIQEKAEKMFTNEQIINNQGQITNQKKFNQAMLALMEDKFTGGAAKQAQTLKGAWSTVTGTVKSALANVMGMQSDGTVRAGSAFDIIREKMIKLAETLDKWQQDGTIDRIAEKVGNVFSKACNTAADAIKWLKDNADWLIPVAKNLLKAMLALKGISVLKNAFDQVKTVIDVLGKAFTGLDPKVLLIRLAIAAVVAVVLWLIKNWKKLGKWLEKAKKWFMNARGPIGVFRDAIFGIVGVIQTVVGWIGTAIDKFKELFGLAGDADKINKATGKGASSARSIANSVAGHATGTTYFKGGLTGFSERGRSEAAIFPSGTQIIPHDKVPKMGRGTTITVNYTVQGNMIGNREYMEESGKYIANRIISALGNC